MIGPLAIERGNGYENRNAVRDDQLRAVRDGTDRPSSRRRGCSQLVSR